MSVWFVVKHVDVLSKQFGVCIGSECRHLCNTAVLIKYEPVLFQPLPDGAASQWLLRDSKLDIVFRFTWRNLTYEEADTLTGLTSGEIDTVSGHLNIST